MAWRARGAHTADVDPHGWLARCYRARACTLDAGGHPSMSNQAISYTLAEVFDWLQDAPEQSKEPLRLVRPAYRLKSQNVCKQVLFGSLRWHE